MAKDTNEPAVSEPTVSEPTVNEPAVSEPTVSEPTVSEPTVTVRFPRDLYARATRRAGELTAATGKHVTPARALAELVERGLRSTVSQSDLPPRAA